MFEEYDRLTDMLIKCNAPMADEYKGSIKLRGTTVYPILYWQSKKLLIFDKPSESQMLIDSDWIALSFNEINGNVLLRVFGGNIG